VCVEWVCVKKGKGRAKETEQAKRLIVGRRRDAKVKQSNKRLGEIGNRVCVLCCAVLIFFKLIITSNPIASFI